MFGRYRLGYQVLLALVVVELAIAVGFGVSPVSSYFSVKGFIIKTLPVWALLPLCWASFVSVEMARRQVDRPFLAMRRMLHRHRHWLGRGLLFVIIMMFIARGITSLKVSIPSYVAFYADPWLIQADQAIFGIDPWRLTHAFIGPIGTLIIDRGYALWLPIMMLYIGWFCFSRNQALQLRGLLSFLLCWALLGNFFALALSSVGPCFFEQFYHDARFAPLMAEIRAADAEYPLLALKAMNFLISSVGKDNFGRGISAMPSMHVAIAFLCFLVAWEYGRHWWAKLLGFLFFAFILVGSVHLGWHYAVDGIVSVIVTGLIWWGTGRFVKWLDKREAAQAVSAAVPLAQPAPA